MQTSVVHCLGHACMCFCVCPCVHSGCVAGVHIRLARHSNANVSEWKTPAQWDRAWDKHSSPDWPFATTNKSMSVSAVCVCVYGKINLLSISGKKQLESQ